MGWREMLGKAQEKAKDPEFQAKVKQAAQKAAEQRRRSQSQGIGAGPHPGQRRPFMGGNVGSPGYPFRPGHPGYGQYAHAGFYDDDGQWYDQDSDGDGIPDSQDSTPYGEDQGAAVGDDFGNGGDFADEATLDEGDVGEDFGGGGDFAEPEPEQSYDVGGSEDYGGDYGGGGDFGGGDSGGGDSGGGDSGGGGE